MATNIAAAQEVDQLIKKAMKLLHSSHPNSAAELRIMLEEAIKQRHGAEKMLSSSLTVRLIEDEANFPGRMVTPPAPLTIPTTTTTIDEIINLTNSPAKTISDSPDTIQDSDDGMSCGGINLINTSEADDGNLKDFGDLNCCICGEMMFTATNRLIECSKCSLLYHQECHKPPITDASDDHEHIWQCDTCSNKPTTSKSAGLVPIQIDEPIMPLLNNSKTKSSAASSHSSSSSNSSSPFYKPEHSTSTTGNSSGSSSKHGHKSSSSSSSKSHKDERPTISNKTTSSGIPMPTINVISAPDKHSSSTGSSSSSKRSSSHSSGKSTSKSSSSSSSKHHESSSSRKSRSTK